jgi:hypothetical protein
MAKSSKIIQINRAPVLTLWAAVVAERLGFEREEALSLAKAVAGLNAQSKGRRLGIFQPSEESADEKRKNTKRGEQFHIGLLGRRVAAKNTGNGIRAVSKDRTIQYTSVERYLENKFGDDLDQARKAMEKLAKAYDPDDLAEEAYDLYTEFRPDIPGGKRGWGASGDLDLGHIRKMSTNN